MISTTTRLLFLISISVYPESLVVTIFKDDIKRGDAMVFRITNLKYSTATDKPVYELQKKSQQENDKYIFFRPMPLGWSYGIKTIFEGGSGGFRSNGNIRIWFWTIIYTKINHESLFFVLFLADTMNPAKTGVRWINPDYLSTTLSVEAKVEAHTKPVKFPE